MRSRIWISWCFALALAAAGAAAQAAPLAVPVEGDPVRLPQPLPGGPAPSPWIEAARNLPAARAAVARMQANGYARTPEFDAAQARDGRSVVALAFADPANPEHAPIVVVATEAAGPAPRTWVAGGVFRVERGSARVSLATDVPEANQFIAAGDTGAADPAAFLDAHKAHRTLNDWVNCSLVGCGAALGGCVKLGSMLGIPPQAQAGCAIAGCGILSFICLW